MPDPKAEADAQVCAHADAWQQVWTGQAMDGIALLDHVTGGGSVVDGVAVQPGDVGQVEDLFDRRGSLATLVVTRPRPRPVPAATGQR